MFTKQAYKVLIPFAIMIACFAIHVPAQSKIIPPTALPIDSIVEKDSVFNYCDTMPSFPGGHGAYNKFIREHLKYPGGGDIDIMGTVYVSVIIHSDGEISDIKVIRDFGYGTGEEAIRTVKLMPRWKPAIKNGKAVACRYRIPVKFTIN
jgi:protein TonB